MIGVMTLSLVMSVAPVAEEVAIGQGGENTAKSCVEVIWEAASVCLVSCLGEPDVTLVPPYRTIFRYWRLGLDVEVDDNAPRVLGITPWLFKISPLLPATVQQEMRKLQGGWLLVRRDGEELLIKAEGLEVDGDYMTWIGGGVGVSLRFVLVPASKPQRIQFLASRRGEKFIPKLATYHFNGDELVIRLVIRNEESERVYQRQPGK